MGRAMKGVEPLARDFFGVKPHRLALLCCFALFAPFAPAARFGLLRFQSRSSVGSALQSHHSNGFLAQGSKASPSRWGYVRASRRAICLALAIVPRVAHEPRDSIIRKLLRRSFA